MVPMRDGVKLATDIYVPDGENQAFPVLVVHGLRAGRPSDEYDRRSLHGARVCICVPGYARGRGDSEGTENTSSDDGWGSRMGQT